MQSMQRRKKRLRRTRRTSVMRAHRRAAPGRSRRRGGTAQSHDPGEPNIHCQQRSDPAADCGNQFDPRTPCRVRHCARVGRNGVEYLLDVIADPSDGRVPELAGALWLPASRAQENAVIPPRGIEVVDLQCRPVELALKLAHRLRIHLLIDLDRK